MTEMAHLIALKLSISYLRKVEEQMRDLMSESTSKAISVIRLDDLLGIGQIFKAFGKNYYAQISHILRRFL